MSKYKSIAPEWANYSLNDLQKAIVKKTHQFEYEEICLITAPAGEIAKKGNFINASYYTVNYLFTPEILKVAAELLPKDGKFYLIKIDGSYLASRCAKGRSVAYAIGNGCDVGNWYEIERAIVEVPNTGMGALTNSWNTRACFKKQGSIFYL